MTAYKEVVVLRPDYWASRSLQLAQLLGSATVPNHIADPSGNAPDPDTVTTIAYPDYWSSKPKELAEVLNLASGATVAPTIGSGVSAGAIAPTQERLTLTVEEAAAALGISRAFAYESVRRGDIPHIKIGRRVLVPRAALSKLLASAMPDEPTDT